jgi:hypothetical protein
LGWGIEPVNPEKIDWVSIIWGNVDESIENVRLKGRWVSQLTKSR